MAKQIKVIKCPQCGNSKPLVIGKDHYRCDKCNTEFFLDNDDVNVNVNVNHHYDTPGNTNNSPFKVVVIIILFIAILFIILGVRFCVNQVRNVTQNVTTYIPHEKKPSPKKYLFSLSLPANGQGVAFFLANRKSDDTTYVAFWDIINKKIIREQKITPQIDRGQEIVHRRFLSDGADYVIINHQSIYRIDPGNYTFTNITAGICGRKPALNAGFMFVDFVPEGQGEGFRMHTNLGKELYYFPVSDMLYTEKAFKLVSSDYQKGTLSQTKDVIYYLFLNKESAHSSNVAQLLEITYRFNNGGPENKLLEVPQSGMKNLEQHRIVSCKPITEERIYFSPEILYYDPENILISYHPSLAKDAGTHLQLLDTSGNIVWTKPLKNNEIKCINTIRTNQGFILQTDESNFFEISHNSQQIQTYALP